MSIKGFKWKIKSFTGISDVYEEPQYAEIVIDTDKTSIEEATKIIIQYIKENYVK